MCWARASRNAGVHEQSGYRHTTKKASTAQAEALSSQTLEIQRRVLGPEHPDTLESMSNLADSYGGQGKYAKAEALFNQSLKIASHVLGPENPTTLDDPFGFASHVSETG